MERPLQYSWVIPDRLAVGERPRSHLELLSLRFRAVLSLQEDGEPAPEGAPEGLRFERIPIRDGLLGGVPSLEQIARAVDALRRFQDSGLRTYVHCYAGVGRSPTICMAYLALEEGLTLGEARKQVEAAHQRACPTPGQLAALAEFLSHRRERGFRGKKPPAP